MCFESLVCPRTMTTGRPEKTGRKAGKHWQVYRLCVWRAACLAGASQRCAPRPPLDLRAGRAAYRSALAHVDRSVLDYHCPVTQTSGQSKGHRQSRASDVQAPHTDVLSTNPPWHVLLHEKHIDGNPTFYFTFERLDLSLCLSL